MNSYTKVKIRPDIIIRFWKKINNSRDKKKVWVAKDFSKGGRSILRHLETLRRMNLIERVPVVYYCGTRKTVTRKIKGYRLKRRWSVEE